MVQGNVLFIREPIIIALQFSSLFDPLCVLPYTSGCLQFARPRQKSLIFLRQRNLLANLQISGMDQKSGILSNTWQQKTYRLAV